MAFGLKGAPATFQKLMNTALSGLTGIKCFVYLDDIVVYGNNLQDHNNKLRDVFERLKKFHLKLQPSKCLFLRKEIGYLGHMITREGVKPDPSNITALKKYPAPTNQKELKYFLGLAGYYRRFIDKYSYIAKPFNKMTSRKVELKWNLYCDESFKKLKIVLCNPPILVYPDFNKEFILTTDASNLAIGSILSQITLVVPLTEPK